MNARDVRLAHALFLASGAISLVYEVVWTRRLNVILGSAAPAAAGVFAIFLGGLGLGAALVGRRHFRRPLASYALLELALALAGALSPHAFALLDRALAAIPPDVTSPAALLAIRLAGAAVVLLPPAAIMGATLPLMLRHLSGEGARHFPSLYGINTVGAVAGALLAGFVLVARLGEGSTLRLAAATNAAVGLVALAAASRWAAPAPVAAAAAAAAAAAPASVLPPSLRALALSSGFLTLLLEIVWFRLLGQTVGGSAQALSLLLAAFLAGLAAGSLAVGRTAREEDDLASAYADRMLRVGLAAALMMPLSLALPPAIVTLLTWTRRLELAGPLSGLMLAAIMGYGTTALGASLPLLVARASRAGVEGGSGAGALYAASSAGSIAGSLLASFVLVPWLGLDGVSVLCACLAAAVATAAAPREGGRRHVAPALLVALLSLGTPLLYRHPSGLFVIGTYAYAYTAVGVRTSAPPPPRASWPRYASLDDPARPRFVPRDPPEGPTTWIFRRDGLAAAVAVGESAGVRSLLINGKTDASSFGPGDMRTQLLLGHLPALLSRAPQERALCIGLGSGTTVTALATHSFRELLVAEVEPAVHDAARLFEGLGGGLPPSATLRIDDGRQVLARDPGPFAVITSEPSNLWMAGVAHLFTREFFELAHARLADGGVFCQWVHLYQIGEDDVRMLLRTLAAVFPRMALFADGPDLLILAGDAEPFGAPAELARRLARPEVRAHLARGSLDDAPRLLETYLGDEAIARRFAGSGALNTDDRPILEFQAPRSLLRDDSERILAGIAGVAAP